MRIVLKIALFAISALPPFAYAQNPSITTFVVSPASIGSGDIASFAWQLQEAGGYSFLVPCYTGIKLKYANGATLTCGSKISTTAKVNDTLTFYVHNTSGSLKTITAKLTPKDSAGIDYDPGSKEVSVTAATLAEPIIKFSASKNATVPGEPIILSWQAAAGVDGVNLRIDCKEGVRASSPSYIGILPCGTPIFANDLAPSGTLTLNFNNSSAEAVPFQLTLLPTISPKSYDATHASNITVIVASDILPDPAVSYFTASSTVINSWEEAVINWTTVNSKGANIIITCVESVSATSSKNPSLVLPCDKLAFNDALAASGNLKLYFQNKNQTNQTVSVSLLPSKTIGTYDATRGKSVSITVKPKEEIIAPPPLPSVTPSVGGAPIQLPPPTKAPTTPPPPAKTTTPPASPSSSLGGPPAPQTAPTQKTPAAPIKTKSEISQKLLENKDIISVTDIKPVFNNHFYEVRGRKRAKILFLIPASMEIEFFINAETGDIISEKKPWWAFLII